MLELRRLRIGAMFALQVLAGCGNGAAGGPEAGADVLVDAVSNDAVADAADESPSPDASDDASDAMRCAPTTLTPSARGDAVGVVDPQTGVFWMFGGDVGTPVSCMPSPSFAADTWSYDPACDQWTQHTIDGAPSPRARMSAALDTQRRRLVMFGGRFRATSSGAYTNYNEVWALDLAAMTWSQLQTTGTAPSARVNASAVYDPTSDELVIFGGNTSTSGLSFTPQNDTWALNLGTLAWRRVQTTGTPPSAREFHAATLVGRTMIVMDGGGANAFQGPFYDDAYALDLATSTWSTIALHGDNPGGRISLALVPDPDAQRVLLLAGHDDGALGNRNDAYAVALDGTVTQLVVGDTLNNVGAMFCDFPPDFTNEDTMAPERRSAFVAALDAANHRAVVFGGKTDCGITNDTWALDTMTGAWRPLRFTGQGISCQRSGQSGCTSLCN